MYVIHSILCNRPIKKYQRTHSSSKNASDTFAEYITLSVVWGTSDSTIASVFRNAFAPISFLQFPRVEILSDLDNGPEVSSHRTQFISRLIEFSDKHNLMIELVYYPPYHSKYNQIERCWGCTGATLEWHAADDTWNGICVGQIDDLLSGLDAISRWQPE